MLKAIAIAMPVVLVATGGAATALLHVRGALIDQRRAIAAQWSDVDAALTQRAVLIGEMAETARRLAPIKPETLKEIAEAGAIVTSQAPPRNKMAANDRLSDGLARLLLEAETIPRLRSSNAFLRQQEEIRNSEDRIAVARLKYNDTLEHYNARIQSFPHNMVAKISGFRRNDAYFPTEHF